MSARWAAIVQQSKDHLALDPVFEPTDDELFALDTCCLLLEDLGLCD